MDNGRIYARLRNWGIWLNYQADIGPKHCRCTSIESSHIPDAGDVWDDDRISSPTPDVPDAEAMQQMIRQLEHMEQICLAMRYGGIPAVFRYRRISEHAMQKMADNAETMLVEMLRKVA